MGPPESPASPPRASAAPAPPPPATNPHPPLAAHDAAAAALPDRLADERRVVNGRGARNCRELLSERDCVRPEKFAQCSLTHYVAMRRDRREEGRRGRVAHLGARGGHAQLDGCNGNYVCRPANEATGSRHRQQNRVGAVCERSERFEELRPKRSVVCVREGAGGKGSGLVRSAIGIGIGSGIGGARLRLALGVHPPPPLRQRALCNSVRNLPKQIDGRERSIHVAVLPRDERQRADEITQS